MARIFTSLALFALALMAAALVLGLVLGDIHGRREPDVLRWATIHRLSGMAAALAIVLVDCIGMTYFIGTGRWCREVVETYELSPDLIARSVALKRRAFPWAILSLLTVIAVGALGAAADPATGRIGTQSWVVIHLSCALLGFAFIAAAFFMQVQQIAAHHQVIDEIVAEVRRIREARGL
ncbi:MAG TPA: hypothetical protein VGJ15_08285 [Pirellulales bacterium]